MADLFTLRPARENDLAYINAYSAAEGMDSLDAVDNITVAVNADDVPVGFLRIAIGSSGRAYVNPVVVYKTWRGYDVGRALMEDALATHGSLHLVSRGAQIGFYRALGYEACDWGEIDDGVSEDCAHCSWRDECGPLPMKSPA